MKRIFLSAFILCPAFAGADLSKDYLNFIRQIQQDTGVEWDVSVARKGNALSQTEIDEGGSLFELWSIHTATGKEYLLDKKFVSAYTPKANIEIIAPDTYGGVKRTRVDQPFQVKVTVKGLDRSGKPEVPAAAKSVLYTHTAYSYGPGKFLRDGTETGRALTDGQMSLDGTATINFLTSNLKETQSTDLTQVVGEEVFTITANADQDAPELVLDSDRIQIWPIAKASISGWNETAYYENVPNVTFNLTNLYPHSVTFARYYKGQPVATPASVEIVPNSVVSVNEPTPVDKALSLDLDNIFTKEGAYTVEVLHATIFGLEKLATTTISVDRTVEIIGGVFVSE